MKIANFFLDDINSVRILSNVIANGDAINTLVDVMDRVMQFDCCQLYVPSDFYELETDEGILVADLMFSNHSNGLVRDVLLRLQIALGRAEHFPNEVVGFGAGQKSLEMQKGGGLITNGPVPEVAWWDEKSMQLVATAEDLEKSIRKHFVAEKIEEKFFPHFCGAMFGNLYFYVLPEKIKDLGLEYEENIESIITHFSYLNDQAMVDFSGENEDHLIIGRARSFGVVMSPESVSTRAFGDAMKQRDIEIAGEVICCEWHTKLENKRGRIHFYAWQRRPAKVFAAVGNKVIIGKLEEHLKTAD